MLSVDVISIDLSFSVTTVCLNWLNHLWFTDRGWKLPCTHSSIHMLLSDTVQLFLPVWFDFYSTSPELNINQVSLSKPSSFPHLPQSPSAL